MKLKLRNCIRNTQLWTRAGNWGLASLSSSVPIFSSGSKRAACPAQVLQQHQPPSRTLQQLLLFSNWTATSKIQHKRKSFHGKSKHLVGKSLNTKSKRTKCFPSPKKFSGTPPKEIPNHCTGTQGSFTQDMQTMGRPVKEYVWAAACFLLHMPAAGSRCCCCIWRHLMAWTSAHLETPGDSGARKEMSLRVQPTP